jgi:hypothetical protein
MDDIEGLATDGRRGLEKKQGALQEDRAIRHANPVKRHSIRGNASRRGREQMNLVRRR